tara:strand:+ start:218 stop:379 length:162 start_codon:yes stop_codon:yes gene_type:complete
MFTIKKKRSNKIMPENLDGNDPIQARMIENLITIKKNKINSIKNINKNKLKPI